MSICFAILAHESPECIEDLLNNIRFFCPENIILVYNGGKDQSLEDISAPVFPESEEIIYGRTHQNYILALMKWASNQNFDFFVILDSDVLFINHGYEAFLEKTMEESEYMGVNFHTVSSTTGWYPGICMWQEWDKWREIFGLNHFNGALNCCQVFRKSLIKRILTYPKLYQVDHLNRRSELFALEEILFPTLAEKLGANPISYPSNYSNAIRVLPRGESLTLDAVKTLSEDKNCHIVHPIARIIDAPARIWIASRERSSE